MNQLASSGQLRASLFRWALVCVPLVMLLGFLSGQVGGSAADNPWFEQLAKPGIYPPPIAFPVVWSLLYLLMGLALAMVCAARGAGGRGLAVLAFLVQLALNLAWSPLFFGLHEIARALYLLLALDVAVLVTVALFWRVRREAALLLLPYLAWICFASALNFQFLQLNRDADGMPSGNAVTRMQL